MVLEAGTAFVDVEGRFDGLRRSIQREGDAAAQSLGRRISQGFDRIGGQMQSAGRKLTTRLTLPIVGIGVGILKVAGDFQSSMNQVRAVTGAAGDEFDQLSGLAKDLGRTTQFSASQAADAMYFLASAGFDTNEIMEALPGTLQLAAAANMDLATAADIASNILSGYGMEADELARVNDVLVATFQATNTNVAQLGEAMKFVAPVASGAGVQFEEATAALGLMGNAGIQASLAGTSLRGAISRLLEPTAAVQERLEELGVSALDSDGNLRSLEDIVKQLEDSGADTADMMAIFGLRAGPAMAALVAEGHEALGELTGDLEDSGGVAEHVADVQMEGLNGAMARLKSALEGVAIAIAESGLIDWAAGLAERAGELFTNLSESNPELLRLGVIVAGVLAGAGPVLFVVGSGLRAIGLALSPAGLLLAGLGLLAGAFVAVFGEGDTFGQKVADIGGKLRDFVTEAVDFVKGALTELGLLADETVDDHIVPGFGRIADSGSQMSESLGEDFGAGQQFIRDFQLSAGEAGTEWATITGNMAASAESFQSAVQQVFDTVSRLLGDNQEQTVTWGGAIEFVTRSVAGWFSSMARDVSFAVDAVAGVFDFAIRVVEGAAFRLNRALNTVIDGINNVLGAVGSSRRIPRLPERNPFSGIGRPDPSRTRGAVPRGVVAHSGWMVGEEPPPATRRLDHPLRPDEELVIAQHGERILPRGQGDFLEDAKNTGIRLARSLRDRVTEGIRSSVGKLLNLVPSLSLTSPGGPIGDALTAAARQALQAALRWATGLKDNLVPAASELAGAGQVGKMMAALRAVFPGLPLISGFRPGAITATGNRSYHGMGRAVDIPPRMDVANWIRDNFMAATRELIFSPMESRQIHNGRDHVYSGVTRAMHWDHVHWALQNGGIVRKDILARLGERGPEAVVPLGSDGAELVVRLADDDRRLLERLGHMNVVMDGDKLGETLRRREVARS